MFNWERLAPGFEPQFAESPSQMSFRVPQPAEAGRVSFDDDVRELGDVSALFGWVFRRESDSSAGPTKTKLHDLRTGLSKIDWLDGDAKEQVGSTAVDTRHVEKQGVSSVQPGAGQALQLKQRVLGFSVAVRAVSQRDHRGGGR